jgi:hypothetical protein
VCIASSNGGTTSQDLKTGYLVGATPKYQQYAILVGTITSAVIIGLTMLLLNDGSTHYTIPTEPVPAPESLREAKLEVPEDAPPQELKGVKYHRVLVDEENEPKQVPAGSYLVDDDGHIAFILRRIDTKVEVPSDAPTQKAGKPHTDDDKTYFKVFIREGEEPEGVTAGWYLVDDDHRLAYRMDVPIDQKADRMDNLRKAPERFKAPQPKLFQLIIEGILGGKLPWTLVISGALIAIAMELMGVSALPVAVGMYLGLSTAVPIFFGGMVRWLTDRRRGVSASEAETETSSGVLLASGYIAGGTLCGLLIGFLAMPLEGKIVNDWLNFGGRWFGAEFGEGDANAAKLLALALFFVLAVILLFIGTRKSPESNGQPGDRPSG